MNDFDQQKHALSPLIQNLDKFTFTDKDKDLLLSIDPLIVYEVNSNTNYTEGRQSKIVAIDVKLKDLSISVIVKQMGYGKKLTKEEAEYAMSLIPEYRKTLTRNGFLLPNIFYLESREINGEHRIVSIEKRVGLLDGDKMVAQKDIPRFVKYHLMENVMHTICSVSLTNNDNIFKRLPYSLDLKLANFVIDFVDLKVYFVDVFGPKNINDNGFKFYSEKLDSLSPGTLIQITGTRVGAILRFYRLMEISWSKSEENILPELRNYFFGLLERMEIEVEEKDFIISEIKNGYGWLDSIYQEKKV